MTLPVASERSIFSKNHYYKNFYKGVFHVAVNTYVPIFWGLYARGGGKLRTDTPHSHTRDNHCNDNNKDYSKR